MKWLGIGAGLVVAGVVGTVALLPRLIDWNAYRPEIAALAASAVGRPVVIDGPIRAELFPTPQVTAGRIRVLGPSGAADIAAIRWAEARFKFSDLLRGDITLTDLALIEMDAALSPSVFESVSMVAPAVADQSGVPEQTSGANSLAGGSERRDATRIEIRNGTFIYSQPDGATIKAERVSGQIETPSVGRRIAVALSGEVEGRQLSVEMRITPPSRENAAPMAFLITDTAAGARIRVEGNWTMPVEGHRFSGGFVIDGPTLSAVAALLGRTSVPNLGETGPVRIDGKVDYSGDGPVLALEDLSINMDALSATGSAVTQWDGRPRTDLTLRVGRLDLDALNNPKGEGAGSAATSGGEGSAVPGMPLTQAEGQNLMAWIGDLPADITLDLSVAGARLRDTVVRRITIRGSVERGTVTLEELSAQLPGGTDLSIAGFGDMTGPEPLLEGNATLRADDLRRLLDWAGIPVPNVSADRLRRFSLVSGISLGPRRLDIIDAAVEIDGVTATAAAAVALRRRVGVGVRMTLDHINLDAYRPVALPLEAVTPQAGAPETGADDRQVTDSAAGAGQAGDASRRGDEESIWAAFDASVEISVGRAVALGIPFKDVAGELVLKDGVLTVNEVSFQDAGGISGTLGGQMALATGDDAAVMAFEGNTKDLGQISALMEGPDGLSSFLRSLGPMAIKASYQPSADGPSLIVQAQGVDGSFAVGATPLHGQDSVPTLDIMSGALEARGISVSGLSGRMTFPPDLYQLEKLSGTLNGGTLNLSGSLRRRDDGLRQLLITGALDNMAVDRDLAELNGPISISGTISIRGQGEATGSDWRAMAALNEGWFDIDGVMAMRIGPSESGIVRVVQVDALREELRYRFSRPSPVRGSMRLENGVLKTADTVFGTSGSGTLGLTGRLGLRDLDLFAALVLREGDAGPVLARLKAEGPALAPNLRLEGAGPSE